MAKNRVRHSLWFCLALWAAFLLIDRSLVLLDGPLSWITGSAFLLAAAVLVYRSGLRSKLLTRLEFATVFFLVFGVFVAVGTLVVQGRPAAFYASAYPAFLKTIILGLGLNDLYYTGWFSALLVLLVVSLAATSLRIRNWRFWLLHLGIVVIIAGAAVGHIWGVKGYMALHTGQGQSRYQIMKRHRPTPNHGTLPFSVTLDRFQVVYYPERLQLVVYETTAKGLRPVAVSPAEPDRRLEFGPYRLDILKRETLQPKAPNHPAVPRISLRLHRSDAAIPFELTTLSRPAVTPDRRFTIALTQRRDPREFSSTVTFTAEGEETQKELAVNHPARFRGYRFYQTDYDEQAGDFSGLTVKRDPGFPLVLAGMFMVLLGVVLTFLRRPHD